MNEYDSNQELRNALHRVFEYIILAVTTPVRVDNFSYLDEIKDSLYHDDIDMTWRVDIMNINTIPNEDNDFTSYITHYYQHKDSIYEDLYSMLVPSPSEDVLGIFGIFPTDYKIHISNLQIEPYFWSFFDSTDQRHDYGGNVVGYLRIHFTLSIEKL